MGELRAFITRELVAAGVDISVANRLNTRIESTFSGNRVYIGKPVGQAKRQILEFGSTVPSTHIARQLGVTVQHVRRVRRMAR